MAIWMLAAKRRGSARPGQGTLLALALVWIYAAAALVNHGVFGAAAVVGAFGGPTLGVRGADAFCF